MIARLSALTLALGLLAAGDASAQERQRYGDWQKNDAKGYFYRKFEYKVQPADTEYKHEYVLYFPNDAKRDKWLYFYNPRSEKVWARYPTATHPTWGGQAQARAEAWSVLPPKYRQKDAQQIDPSSYPEPSTNLCPTIPNAPDNVNLSPPPPDLP